MMKKLSIGLVTVVSFFLLLGSSVLAEDVDVVLTVTMPTATSIKVALHEIDSKGTQTPDDDAWTELSPDIGALGTINFDAYTMEKNADGVYDTKHYYALDIAPEGGGWSGTTGVTFGYAPGANDIAEHTIATLWRAVWTSPTSTVENDVGGGKRALDNLPANIPTADLIGGWLRIYIGLAMGELDEPAGVTPFTDATAPGTYTGTLTITYTGA